MAGRSNTQTRSKSHRRAEPRRQSGTRSREDESSARTRSNAGRGSTRTTSTKRATRTSQANRSTAQARHTTRDESPARQTRRSSAAKSKSKTAGQSRRSARAKPRRGTVSADSARAEQPTRGGADNDEQGLEYELEHGRDVTDLEWVDQDEQAHSHSRLRDDSYDEPEVDDRERIAAAGDGGGETWDEAEDEDEKRADTQLGEHGSYDEERDRYAHRCREAERAVDKRGG